MKILIAPQEFKGALTSAQAAQAIASAVAKARPEFGLDVAPLADGGPGTVEAFLSATPGQRKVTRVTGPLGQPVEAAWAMLENGTAVIEMAAASGLCLLEEASYDPLAASSYGTGELIRAALDAKAGRILVGAGGSATNDGGVGAAMALGARLLDEKAVDLPRAPSALARLSRVDLSGVDPRLSAVPLEVMTDVRNPLCGPEGASHVYGPQKGADAETCELLDANLARLARCVEAQLGKKLSGTPGSGAGGGLGFGLAALCGATISSGFDAVSAVLGLFSRIRAADLVVTGEGRLDEQSAYFKGPYALARLARMQHKRVVIFAGAVGVASGPVRAAFDELVVVTPPGTPLAEAKSRAFEFLQAAATRWASGLADR